MPGHAGVYYFSQGAPNVGIAAVSDASAHKAFQCGHCGSSASGAVVARVHEADFPTVEWLRCPTCHKGSVSNSDVVTPALAPGEALEGLPAVVGAAYEEARACLSVRAYTSAELICRKVLMNVAVDKGAKEDQSFAAYLEYLAQAGYVTPPMKPWVDLIRQHGNLATHEIPATDPARAEGTVAFTAQLLRLIYEMDHKVQQYMTKPTATSD